MVRRSFGVMLVAALCACGRIAFDTTANGDGGGGSGDTGGAGDGSGGSGDASGDGGAPANWTVFSPSPSTASDLFAVASFAGNNVWIGGAAGITYQFDGTTWTPRTGPTVDVRRFWGQSATDLWAVGVNCVVQRWDGNAWNGSTVTGCVSGAFFGIGGVAATDLWVGGAGGRLNHLVGTTWTLEAQANNIDLWGVWAVATNDVYVTGTRGTILHWTGSQMVDESIPPSVTVTSIWGVNGNDLWAVAQTGLIYRKMNNGIWIQQTSPTTQFLWQIWGTAADDIWAVGDGATVIHYDGTQWSTVSVPIASTVSLRGIAPVPGGGLRAVGTSGTVLAHP